MVTISADKEAEGVGESSSSSFSLALLPDPDVISAKKNSINFLCTNFLVSTASVLVDPGLTLKIFLILG